MQDRKVMSNYTVSEVCRIQKMSRQAYYQYEHRVVKKRYEEEMVIQMVQEKRKRQPRIGVRKLYHMLESELRAMGNKIGRDGLFALLRDEGLLVRLKRNNCRTTNSNHWFWVYTNLLVNLSVTYTNQVWVSDITYLNTENGFVYLSLITDYYSRKIIGYSVSQSLSIEGSVEALQMAQGQIRLLKGIIHHSDRGIQYCSYAYTGILKKANMQISMGERGNPYDNAIAERVNGILKMEFLLDERFKDIQGAFKRVKESIEIYNKERPHMNLNYHTPEEVYKGL
ncbi:MAG: IS3 family transposase [Ignavibacteriales bacterium]|nr:IS3 family transposase [Ignavibacteriales bacterium]